MDQIMQFFDLARDCPAEIPNCQNYRNEYVRELNELKLRGGCGTCIEKQLKQGYMLTLQALLKI